MRGALALIVLLGGCNAIFGLAPTSLAGDGGTGDDADHRGGPDAAAGDAAPTTNLGAINATSYGYTQDGSLVNQYAASAAIGHTSPVCETTPVDGACEIVRCVTAPDPGPWPDTGTIQIIGSNVVALAPDGNGGYASQSSGTMRLFLDGDSVEIGSTGGEVPAIDVVFAAPHSIAFTSGLVPDSSTSATYVRSQSYPFTWTGGGVSETVALVVQDPLGAQLVCRFAAGAGGSTGTIPSTGLVQLTPGGGSFTAVVYTEQGVDAGAYALDLSLDVVAHSPTGDWARGAVNLQ